LSYECSLGLSCRPFSRHTYVPRKDTSWRERFAPTAPASAAPVPGVRTLVTQRHRLQTENNRL